MVLWGENVFNISFEVDGGSVFSFCLKREILRRWGHCKNAPPVGRVHFKSWNLKGKLCPCPESALAGKAWVDTQPLEGLPLCPDCTSREAETGLACDTF